MARLFKLRNFATRAEAEMAKGILEANGVVAIVQMTASSVAIHYIDRSGESDLLVKEADLAKAHELLDAYMENSR